MKPGSFQFVMQLLLRLLATACLIGAASAWGAAPSDISITGLDGVSAQVSWLVDTKEGHSVEALERVDAFQPIEKPIRQWLGLTGLWLRIDISKPDTAPDQEVYLQVKPAFLYDLQLHRAGLAPQSNGMGLAFNQHSSPALTPVFLIDLHQPLTRVYVRMSGVMVQISQLKLFSAEALLKAQQSDGQLNGLFLGAMIFMVLLSLINWSLTNEKVYLPYAFLLGSIVALALLTSGLVSAYLFPDQPLVVLLLLKFCISCVVSSTIFFSISILRLEAYSPQLARAMGWLGWLLLLGNLCVFKLTWMPMLVQFNAGVHIACSLLFVVISIHQLAVQPDRKNLIFCSFYVLFTMLDKVPMLQYLWLESAPFTSWPFDSRKVIYLVQLLPMHGLIVMQLLATQKLKSAAERHLLEARITAKNEKAKHSELNRFLGLLGHEIRTPLAVIDSAAQSLELLPGALEPERRKRHLRIRAMVQKLNRLLADTLKRESIESEGLEMQWNQYSASDLLDVVLSEFNLERSTSSPSGSMRLPLQVSGQPGWLEISLAQSVSLFECDLHLLQIAVSNLVDNACKYADPGSTVQLFIDYLRPITTNEKGRLSIRVLSISADLKEEDVTKVFTKYWRHQSHHHLQGSGLGLSLVHHIMQLHDGTAKAEVLANGWICFALQMPRLRP